MEPEPHSNGRLDAAGSDAPPRFPVVGLVAAEGGIEAVARVLGALPARPGAAFVVLLRAEEDGGADRLSASAAMPVEEVRAGVARVEPNRVLFVPPGRRVTFADGIVQVGRYGREEERRAAPDGFLRALADHHGRHAIGIVLSGSGSDGAVGMQRLKERGGVLLAQEPADAEHDGMPRSALATGLIDHVLPAEALAERLLAIGAADRALPENTDGLDGPDSEALAKVLAQLRVRTGQDFTSYKRSTILRRIERRMQVHGLGGLGPYLAVLRQQPQEAQALFQDLLISVTQFFRDPAAWAALEREVIPHQFEGKGQGDHVRAWVAGCATGEEAYSVAILLLEHAAQLDRAPDVQVFATDLDEDALEVAREGLYPEAIAADVSAERLQRFFVKEGAHYRVRPEVRDRILFATHSLVKDPPFFRLDLVACRNLLIYYNRDVQERAFELFHYALRPKGCLFLGSSESVDGASELFRSVSKRHRLFERRPSSAPPPALALASLEERRTRPRRPADGASETDVHERMLEAYAPPSVLVDEAYEIAHLSESAGRYLQLPAGRPNLNVLRAVRKELQLDLRIALTQAFERGHSVGTRPVPVTLDGEPCRVHLIVRPSRGGGGGRRLALVLFCEVEGAEGDAADPTDGGAVAVRQLEVELERAHAQTQATVEEYETAHEELLAANEELQSMNEEYRSTAEELETSKEELQSMNEELLTLNAELREKVEEVTRAHVDLQYLMASTEIATLFLDRDGRVQRYTPRIADLFNILPGDRGRSLDHLTHQLKGQGDLAADAARVLDTLQPVEQEVEDRDGRHYLLRLRPYRTAQDRIEGVVLTFVDITDRKRAEEALQEAKIYAESIIDTLHEPLLVLTPALHVRSANPAFYAHFEVRPEETIGRLVYELGNNQWDIPALRTLLEDVLPDDNVFNDFEVTHDFDSIGRRVMLINARRLDHTQLILLGVRDITERKQVGEALHETGERYRTLVQNIHDYAIFRLDPDGLVTEWTEGAQRVKGYTAEEVLGRHLAMFFTEEDVAAGEVERELAEAAEAGRAEREGWRVRKGGERFWVNEIATAIRDADGALAGFTKISRDLTERRRAEEAIHESEARYRLLVEHVREYAIFAVDLEGRVATWNDGARRVFGWDEAEIVGQFDDVLFTPEDRAAGVPARETGTAAAEGQAPDERWHIRKNGERFWARGMMTAVRGGDGALDGFVKICRDDTERQQADEALRQSEERFRRALIASALPVMMHAEDGEILAVSDALVEITGYARDELRRLEDWVRLAYGGDRGPEALAMIEAYFRDERPVEMLEMGVRTRSGEERTWVFSAGAPERLPDGRRYYVCFANDITARATAEEALRQAKDTLEVRVEERTADLARRTDEARALAGALTLAEQHERKQIAQVLHDHVQQVLFGARLKAQMAAEDVGAVPDEALRADLSRVNELLGEALRATRTLTVDLSPPVLRDEGLVAALDWLALQMKEQHGLGIAVEAETDARLADTNLRVLVFGLVRELLFNVVKHAGVKEAAVRVREEAGEGGEPGRVVVTVEDEGAGFDPARTEHVPRPSESRTGFGLYSARERLALLGGHLDVEAQPRRGTRATITVPLPASTPSSRRRKP